MPQRDGIQSQVMAVPEVGQPKTGPSLNADLQPLVNKADLAYQRAEVAIAVYAQSPQGTARRELYERTMLGERVEDVSSSLQDTKGLRVPPEDLAYLKEYQDKRFVSVPHIELTESVAAHVYSPRLDAATGVYTSSSGGSRSRPAIQDEMTGEQLHAIEEHKASVNAKLGQAAGTLATLEADGAKGTAVYEQALKEYEKLRFLADPNPATLQMSMARGQAQDRLKGLEADPEKASTLSPALKGHWERVATGGGTAGIPGGLGTGVPKPSLNGRFAGMEDSRDLALSRQEVAQTALLAQPGAPNADRLVASLRYAPQETGLDSAALQAMWEDRRARLNAHQAFLDAPAAAVPDGRLAVDPRHLQSGLGASGVGPIELDQPPFAPTGRTVPPSLGSHDGSGDGPTSGDRSGGNGAGPGGPGGQAPSAAPDFAAKAPRGIATVSPETHSASVLEQQIRSVEQAARARIRTMHLMTAATIAGSTAITAAEIALEVASAPMNPNADPAKALLGVGQGINTVSREMMANHRQMVHERTKADSDLKNLMDTYTRDQRQHAGEWAEKMSNQLGHLDQIKPGAVVLDQAEIRVGQQVLADPAVQARMVGARDQWAYDTHLAAANEMAMSSHEGLKAQGQAIAMYLDQNRGKLASKSWDEISQALADPSAMADVRTPGSVRAVYKPLDTAGAYQTVLGDLDRQHQAQMVQDESQARLVSAADKGTLHELVGPGVASQLGATGGPDHLTGLPQDGKDRLTGAELNQALIQKHTVERSIEASWRDFTARAPIHAERVMQGGMDPNRLLNQLYHRGEFQGDGAMAPSLEQQASKSLHSHFMEVRAQGEAGVPNGWGEPTTLGGDKVGLAPSANGGTQALLIGFDPKTNRAQGATIHLYAGQGIRPKNEALADLTDTQRAAFEQGRAQEARTAGPHAVLDLDQSKLASLKLQPKEAPGGLPGVAARYVQTRYTGAPDPGFDHAAKTLQEDYDGAVQQAYDAHGKQQLSSDADLFARVKTGQTSGLDFDATKAKFVRENEASYKDAAGLLARRESMDRASAMTIAIQLKNSATYGGFHQVVEGNRGHFNYKPHSAALDLDPRRALEGRSGGDSEGRDFRRMMDQADGVFRGIPEDVRRGREAGVTAFKYGLVNHLKSPGDYILHKDVNKNFLLEMSPATAQAKTIMDDPIRQSQIARVGHTRAASTHSGMDGADGFRSVKEFLDRDRKSA